MFTKRSIRETGDNSGIDLPWDKDRDPGRPLRILWAHVPALLGLVAPGSYLLWEGWGHRASVAIALFFLLMGALAVGLMWSQTVLATAITWKELAVRTPTGTKRFPHLQILEVKARHSWAYGSILVVEQRGGRKREYYGLERRRVDRLAGEARYAKGKVDQTVAAVADKANEAPAAEVETPQRPVRTWAFSVLPSGHVVSDSMVDLASPATHSAGSGVWISENQRQELAIHWLAVALTLSLFAAPALYLALVYADIIVSNTQFCLMSFVVGSVLAVAFGKKFDVGQRGKSTLWLPAGTETSAQADAIVRKAVALGGWRVSSEGGTKTTHEWTLDIPITLKFLPGGDSKHPGLFMETIGRQHMVDQARLKGWIVEVLKRETSTSTTRPEK